ncbi:MAG: glycosyltransferase family 2 protein [Gammaproteobacteria bacterium]
MKFTSRYLKLLGNEKSAPGSIPCIALLHNEKNILPDFLQHYRSLGNVAFFIVDDRSDDGSRELLERQPDVTLFEPEEWSSYKEHKREWRSDLLDSYADGRWVMVPDLDEHFVYHDMERLDLAGLTGLLEAEGAEALLTIMVDMYADKPLSGHHYAGGGLLEAFPYFDADTDPVTGYRLLPPATRFLKKYPTPRILAFGGMRDRLFFSRSSSAAGFQALMLRKYAHMKRPLNPGPFDRFMNSLARRTTRSLFSSEPFVCSKIGLLKWSRGMRFSGGAHAVTARLRTSESIAAFLHFKFTKGVAGIEYIANRGQHAGEGLYYKQILHNAELLERSPVFESSVRFVSSASLAPLIRKASQDHSDGPLQEA